VVAVSQQRQRVEVAALPDPICDLCGEAFDSAEPPVCPAREDGGRCCA